MTKTNSSPKVQLKTALSLFKNKLPCKSSLVPKQIQLMPIIKNRSTEIMKRYCKVFILNCILKLLVPSCIEL